MLRNVVELYERAESNRVELQDQNVLFCELKLSKKFKTENFNFSTIEKF